MKKIYITIEDEWAERWVKCSKFHGHRSAMLRKWFKKAGNCRRNRFP